jgi:prolipoprotein diacylglyceryltransferase
MSSSSQVTSTKNLNMLMHVFHVPSVLKKMVLWVVPVEPAFLINPFYLFLIFFQTLCCLKKKEKENSIWGRHVLKSDCEFN